MGKLYALSLRHLNINDRWKETLLYLVLWLLLFLTPLFSIYIRLQHSGSSDFPWVELFLVWRQYAIFLAVFLVHNYVLAPLLVYRQRRTLYFSCLGVMLALFVMAQCMSRPKEFDRGPFHDRPEVFDRPPMLPPDAEAHDFHPPHGPGPRHDGDHHKPPVVLGEHDIVATIIFVLMIGMNLGVKLYFRHRKDHEMMLQMEKDNLEQQLEYLKYQINPHFLMNTLNNIHALVDIEPEQAKETIVELSKIMRFVLYEGSKQKVPLRQELMFVENYVELMKMRFTDQVSVTVNMPDILPNRDVPPLLLITFVENAFKHGVSYQQKSFVDIDISIDDTTAPTLLFKCSNSKTPQADEKKCGGVGLQNAKRRLELLYADKYTMNIEDTNDTYTVTLTIPL